jgi:hypothetical protein
LREELKAFLRKVERKADPNADKKSAEAKAELSSDKVRGPLDMI